MEKLLEKAKTLSSQFRNLAVNQYRDSDGYSAGCAYLRAAKMIEETFGIESPPDPYIEGDVDDLA